jgi:hypothetical protein
MRARNASFLIVLAVSAAHADEPAKPLQRCLESDTPRQCFRRNLTAVAVQAAKAQLDQMRPKATDDAVARVASQDFNTPVSVKTLTGTPADKQFVFDANALQQIHLQTVMRDPHVSAAFFDAAQRAVLERLLGRGDDTALTLAFNRLTRAFGIAVDPHRRFIESLLLDLAGDALPASAAVAADKMDTPFEQLFPDRSARLAAMTAFETASAAAELPKLAADRIIAPFAKALASQPQIYLSLGSDHRSDVVGPRERNVTLHWEIGADNLNTFRRDEGRDCEQTHSCLAALTAFGNRVERRRFDPGRIALSAGYHRSLSATPEQALLPPFTFEPGHWLSYSVTYGRTIEAMGADKPGAIDVTFNYRTHSTAAAAPPATTTRAPLASTLAEIPGTLHVPPPATRYSVAALVTQPVTRQLSVPVTIAYSSGTDYVATPGSTTVSPALPPRVVARPHSGFSVLAGLQYHVPSAPRPSPPSPPKPQPQNCCCPSSPACR